ncbi:hypothetical protein MMC29_000487 [Sticta canariensis]|nr:hypothetical protein [Sticta canariensis]
MATWNDDGDSSSYTLTESPHPPLSTTTPDRPYIKLVHEVGDQPAVWSIGNSALCKVRYIEKGVTPESVTLDFVRGQQPSFEVPKVLHHACGHNRSYLFQRVPGRTLDAAWPTLNDYCSQLNQNQVSTLPWDGPSEEASDFSTWWRSEVQKALEANGFDDFAHTWMKWRGYNMDLV